MVKVACPSPPKPMPAYEGAFFTKMVVSTARAKRVRRSTFFECICAVWRLPCSAFTARVIASSMSWTRTIGRIGIISSCWTKGCSKPTSQMMQRISGPTLIPILSRITAASRPTQSRLTVFFFAPDFVVTSVRTTSTRRSAVARSIRSAPAFCIPAISSSAIESKAKTSFSAMQGRLLSKVQPSMMSCAAFLMSAVSSTMTGGFPAPAPMAFFPEDSTLLTTPGPPVQTSRRMAGCLYIRSAVSSVGLITEATRTRGPPTAAQARLTRSTA